MSTNYQIILTTCPDQKSAENLAGKLVDGQSAACVNIVPGLTSIYPWQGEIATSQEYLLLIKTHKDRYAAVEQIIRDNHPYELPEIIAVSVQRGSSDYLHWIDSCLVQPHSLTNTDTRR